MKPFALRTRSAGGFSLVELLVVIAIIGILAGMLVPGLAAAKGKARTAKAKVEMSNLAGAVKSYQTTYSMFPASRAVRQKGVSEASPDFTYGTLHTDNPTRPDLRNRKGGPLPQIGNQPAGLYQASNAELMAILLDIERRPDTGAATVNENHTLNPQKNVLLNVTPSSASRLPAPGLGADLLYRDPWSNPYIVTIDLNYDNLSRDGFHRSRAVSQETGTRGLNGATTINASGNDWEVRTDVMVWSFGPDGLADVGTRANAGVNKDNVLSWK